MFFQFSQILSWIFSTPLILWRSGYFSWHYLTWAPHYSTKIKVLWIFIHFLWFGCSPLQNTSGVLSAFKKYSLPSFKANPLNEPISLLILKGVSLQLSRLPLWPSVSASFLFVHRTKLSQTINKHSDVLNNLNSPEPLKLSLTHSLKQSKKLFLLSSLLHPLLFGFYLRPLCRT